MESDKELFEVLHADDFAPKVLSSRSHVLFMLSMWDKRSHIVWKWSACIKLTLMVLLLLGVQKNIRGLPLLLLLLLQPCQCSTCPFRSLCCIWRLRSFTAIQQWHVHQQHVKGTQAAAQAHPPQVNIAPGVIPPPQVVLGVVPPGLREQGLFFIYIFQ